MIDNLVERASLLFEQKRFKEAKKYIIEVLTIEPNNINCLLILAEIEINENDLKQALQIINTAIGLEPDYDSLYYVKARIFLLQNKLNEALFEINEAVSIEPFDSNNYALKGQILFLLKDYEKALKTDNQSLEIDASNIFALNLRSAILLKLGKNEESFATIENALQEDPNNAYTHATFGWNLLEKGENKKALTHFKESLKNDPNFEYAQAGMAEALKSNFIFYKWFLNYSFWLQNKTAKNQWIFIIGFYIIQRLLKYVSAKNPALEPFIFPITVVLALFAVSTWIITPLTNLFFSFNTYGKHLLSKNEIKSSKFVGVSFLLFLFGILSLLFLSINSSLSLIVIGLTLIIPLSQLFKKPALFFISANIIFGILGIGGIFITLISGNFLNLFSILYFILLFIFQFASNYFTINKN